MLREKLADQLSTNMAFACLAPVGGVPSWTEPH